MHRARFSGSWIITLTLISPLYEFDILRERLYYINYSFKIVINWEDRGASIIMRSQSMSKVPGTLEKVNKCLPIPFRYLAKKSKFNEIFQIEPQIVMQRLKSNEYLREAVPEEKQRKYWINFWYSQTNNVDWLCGCWVLSYSLIKHIPRQVSSGSSDLTSAGNQWKMKILVK